VVSFLHLGSLQMSQARMVGSSLRTATGSRLSGTDDDTYAGCHLIIVIDMA
jgi:hypothetical protein